MKRSNIYALVLAGGTLAMATTTIFAEPINVKTGLWETTLHTQASGELPVSPEELQSMTPEMRAMAGKMMARAAAPHASVNRSCLTQKDLDDAAGKFLEGRPGMKCKNKITKHSSSSAAGTVDCRDGEMHDYGEFTLKVLDREHVGGTLNMTFDNGGNAATTRGTMTSRWVSASCGRTE